MIHRVGQLVLAAAAISNLAVPAAASAATHHRTQRHSVVKAGNSTTRSGTSAEAALTGSTLTSADNAALAAVPGGTVSRATTEADGTGAYEVIVTKTDGSRVKVIESSDFSVLSTSATGCR